MDSSNLVDQPSKIREGEELNLERLRQHLEPVIGKDLGSLQISQFPGGHSNLTYFLKTDSEQWVLRRPPFGSKVKSAHDMSREFKYWMPSREPIHSVQSLFIFVMTMRSLVVTST